VTNIANEAFRGPQVAGYVWFLLAAPIAYGSARLPRSSGSEGAHSQAGG
jgi:hypothetical protein